MYLAKTKIRNLNENLKACLDRFNKGEFMLLKLRKKPFLGYLFLFFSLVFLMVVISFFLRKRNASYNLIPPKKMENLLVDLFMYQAIEKNQSRKALLNVLKAHKSSEEQFKKSHAYYILNPTLYISLLSKVEKKIEEKENLILSKDKESKLKKSKKEAPSGFEPL